MAEVPDQNRMILPVSLGPAMTPKGLEAKQVGARNVQMAVRRWCASGLSLGCHISASIADEPFKPGISFSCYPVCGPTLRRAVSAVESDKPFEPELLEPGLPAKQPRLKKAAHYLTTKFSSLF
jgi:hypothetical protein